MMSRKKLMHSPQSGCSKGGSPKKRLKLDHTFRKRLEGEGFGIRVSWDYRGRGGSRGSGGSGSRRSKRGRRCK